MPNKKLTVLVCGQVATGKTTIARKIEEFLAAEGVNVDRVPEIDSNFNWSEESHQKIFETLIDGGLEVVVKIVQLNREGNLTEEALEL